MPQFIDTNGELLALWVEITADDGTLNSYSNLRLIWDKNYSLNIDPLREAAPTFDLETVHKRISEFIQEAKTEALRVLKKYGVTQDDIDFGMIVLRVDENGSIPDGIYAAARIFELIEHIDFTKQKTTVYGAHALALISQYALGDRDFLQEDFNTHCRNQSKIAKKKKGTTGPLKQAIKFLSPNNLPDLIEKFKDDDAIADLYESTIDSLRINVHQFEVYEDNNGYVTYSTRDGARKTVTFKTLKNIISGIK